MKDYLEFIAFNINEAFEQPYELIDDDTNDDSHIYKYFKTESGGDFLLEFTMIDKNNLIYYYKFHKKNDEDVYSPIIPQNSNLSKIEKFKIFSTVRLGLEKFLKDEKVTCLFFAATDKSRSRKGIYSKYCNLLPSDLGNYCAKEHKINNDNYIYTILNIGIKDDNDKGIIINSIRKYIYEKHGETVNFTL